MRFCLRNGARLVLAALLPLVFASAAVVGAVPGAAANASATAVTTVGASSQSESSPMPGPGTWTPVKAPLPADARANPSANLQSVACPAASSCIAAGYYNGTGAGEGLLETLSGGGWTPVTAPLPSDAATNPGVYLYSAACPAVSSCVAVGGYTGTNGSPALIETLSGTTWTPIEAPLPADATNQGAALSSIACPSASACIAVGGYHTSLTVGSGLLETFSGTSWAPMTAPVPSGNGAGTDLSSVACPSASTCLAVGSYADSSSDRQGLLEMLSSSTWTPVKAPLPPDAAANPDVSLGSASCSSAAFCAAAGYYSDTSGGIHGLLETLSSGTWTPVEAPLPANSVSNEVILDSVACTSSSCTSAGQYRDASGHVQGLLENMSGSSWTADTAPLPADASSNPDVGLFSVACVAASSCVAAGDYLNSPSSAHALLEFLSGTTWSQDEAPLPPNADPTGSDLAAVTCSPLSSCVAVGGYWDSSQDHQALLIASPSSLTSATALNLSAATVTYGNEQVEQVSVSVSSAGTPTGTVTVTAGTTTLCTISLVSAAGTCTLQATQLPAGTYQVTGSYSGDANASPSTSPPQALMVRPAVTGPALAILSPRSKSGPAGTLIQWKASGLQSGLTVTEFVASANSTYRLGSYKTDSGGTIYGQYIIPCTAKAKTSWTVKLSAPNVLLKDTFTVTSGRVSAECTGLGAGIIPYPIRVRPLLTSAQLSTDLSFLHTTLQGLATLNLNRIQYLELAALAKALAGCVPAPSWNNLNCGLYLVGAIRFILTVQPAS